VQILGVGIPFDRGPGLIPVGSRSQWRLLDLSGSGQDRRCGGCRDPAGL